MKLKNSKKKRHKRMMPKRIPSRNPTKYLSRKHDLSDCNHQETIKH
ncbi:MAG: hypothetical protein ACP5FU_06755 [Nitrososphaeria archaeon]